MCNPAIGAFVAGGAQVAGGVMQYMMGDYQQQVANESARRERVAGYEQERGLRDKATRDIASQTAALAGQGSRIDTGTPLLLLAESARNSELDALALRSTTNRKADNYVNEGRAAKMKGIMDAFGSATSGASSILSSKDAMAALGAV